MTRGGDRRDPVEPTPDTGSLDPARAASAAPTRHSNDHETFDAPGFAVDLDRARRRITTHGELDCATHALL